MMLILVGEIKLFFCFSADDHINIIQGLNICR